jgi:hypothetical protein
MELVTIDTILGALKGWVEQKQPIPPSTWVEAAAKMNILLGDEIAKQYELEQIVAKMRVEHIKNGDTVAKAEAKIRALDEYKHMKLQEAKVKLIQEQIRLAKKQATITSDEMKGY